MKLPSSFWATFCALVLVNGPEGLRGRHALIILVVSTLLTVAAFMAAYAVNHRNLASVNSAPVTSASDAQGSTTPMMPAQQ